MLYLRSFLRFILISLALLGISFSGQGQAALVLHHFGGPPVADTDGFPLADIDAPPSLLMLLLLKYPDKMLQMHLTDLFFLEIIGLLVAVVLIFFPELIFERKTLH